MSARVSSFERVKIGDYSYLFFVVLWNELQTPITEQLERHHEAFGSNLGPEAIVVQAFRHASYETADQVEKKAWPEEISRRFGTEQDPFLLVIDEDFPIFSPTDHPWAIIWFSDFSDHPERVYEVFGRLGRLVRKGEDVFTALRSSDRKGMLEKLVKYIEIKPEVFGISIDAKAIFEDIAGLERVRGAGGGWQR